MASESRLYSFSPDTKTHLHNFRLKTSRVNEPQAVIYMIDKTTHYIQQDPEAAEVYKSLEEIGEELPTGSPRFVLLSYPLKSSDGRTQVPYMLLYYLPSACNDQMKMMYAGAKELMRSTSGVGRVIDITSLEDLEELQEEFDNKQ